MRKPKADDLRSKYKREELGKGIRGKYFQSYHKGTNLVLLSPDVAKAFPNEEAVNNALRFLISVAQNSTGRTPRSTGRAKKPRSGHAST
jgi:hypothetical protein